VGRLWTPAEGVDEQTHGHEGLDSADQLTRGQVLDQHQDAQGPEGAPLGQGVQDQQENIERQSRPGNGLVDESINFI